jgi:hypothetical protein
MRGFRLAGVGYAGFTRQERDPEPAESCGKARQTRGLFRPPDASAGFVLEGLTYGRMEEIRFADLNRRGLDAGS